MPSLLEKRRGIDTWFCLAKPVENISPVETPGFVPGQSSVW